MATTSKHTLLSQPSHTPSNLRPLPSALSFNQEQSPLALAKRERKKVLIINRLIRPRRPGAVGERADPDALVARNHLGEDVEHGLGDRLVVDADQIARRRVDLEGLVEADGRFDVVGACIYGKDSQSAMATL